MTGEVSNGVMFARARRDGENATDSASQTQVEPGPPDFNQVIGNNADDTSELSVQEPTAPPLTEVIGEPIAPTTSNAVVVGATAWILTILFSL